MIVWILVGIIALVALVVVHELGHAVVARRNGVVVEEFGIGFPPRAWQRRLKNGVLLTLNWLPLGGFVRLKGEHDAARGPGTYGGASYWVKTKILLAGVVVNWVVAALLLSVVAALGMPQVLEHQFSMPGDSHRVDGPVRVVSLRDQSPAQQAGLQPGDRVVSFDGRAIESSQALIEAAQAARGRAAPLTYQRDASQHTVTLDLPRGEGPVLGVGLDQRQTVRATWSAPVVGVVTAGQFTAETIRGLGVMLADLAQGVVGQLSGDEAARQAARQRVAAVQDQVAGPIGILGVIFPAAGSAGLLQVLFLLAIISLTLAVMNVLPIPALDGGRWYTMTIFRIIRQPLTRAREERIQVVGFLIILSLIVLVTIADVQKFF